MPSKKVTIQDFANHFGLVAISGDINAMKRIFEKCEEYIY